MFIPTDIIFVIVIYTTTSTVTNYVGPDIIISVIFNV